jgi:hypothetical protein
VRRSPLGRVLDPSALDAGAGPRARLRIEVPAAWLVEGAELSVLAPVRLACARCDGGGCDACGRSGALRAPAGAGERVLHASVPRAPGGPQAMVLRIPHPFGPEGGIEQLLLELHAASMASPGVTRRAPPRVAIAGGGYLAWPVLAAVVLAILFAVFGR